MVSGCFLLSSIGYYIAFRLFTDFKDAPIITRVILICYGICICFTYWNYDVNYVSALVLGFGFQQICVMELGYLVGSRFKWSFDLRFFLKN